MTLRWGAFVVAMISLHATTAGSVQDLQWDESKHALMDFSEEAIRYFGVDLEVTDSGRIVAMAAWNGPTVPKQIVCAVPDVSRPGQWSPADFHVAHDCLLQEIPGLDIERLHREAVDEVQHWIDSLALPPVHELSTEAFHILRSHASARVEQSLSAAGVRSFLVGAYRRHVQGRSACATAARERLRNDAGVEPCELWPRIITIQSGLWAPRASVVFRWVAPKTPEQRAAATLEAAGLPRCLENLLDYASDFREIRPAWPCGYPFAACGQVEHAWAVWRSHGLAQWLEQTLQSGDVPPDAAAVIKACAEQRVFPEPATEIEGPRFAVMNSEGSTVPAVLLVPSADTDSAGLTSKMPPLNAVFSLRLTGDSRNDRELQPEVRLVGDDWWSISCGFPWRAMPGAADATESMRDLWIAERCLAKDGLHLDFEEAYGKALDSVRRYRETPQRREVSPDEAPEPTWTTARRLLKESELEAILLRELDAAGVIPYLQGAWARHVVQRSDCYREESAEVDRQMNNDRDSGAECPASSWRSFFDLDPRERRSFANSTKIDPHLALEHPYHLALEKLEPDGLRQCLDRLLEDFGDRRTMTKLGMFDMYPPPFDEIRRQRYVWSVWRQFGLEEWIRETALTGEVSHETAKSISECARGRAPSARSACPFLKDSLN